MLKSSERVFIKTSSAMSKSASTPCASVTLVPLNTNSNALLALVTY